MSKWIKTNDDGIGTLGDVDMTTTPPVNTNHLEYDGTNWVPVAEPSGGGGGASLGTWVYTTGTVGSGNFRGYDGAIEHTKADVTQIDIHGTDTNSNALTTIAELAKAFPRNSVLSMVNASDPTDVALFEVNGDPGNVISNASLPLSLIGTPSVAEFQNGSEYLFVVNGALPMSAPYYIDHGGQSVTTTKGYIGGFSGGFSSGDYKLTFSAQLDDISTSGGVLTLEVLSAITTVQETYTVQEGGHAVTTAPVHTGEPWKGPISFTTVFTHTGTNVINVSYQMDTGTATLSNVEVFMEPVTTRAWLN